MKWSQRYDIDRKHIFCFLTIFGTDNDNFDYDLI